MQAPPPDKYIAEHNVDKRAADEAMLQRPPTAATSLDANELKCVQVYEQALNFARHQNESDAAKLRAERRQLEDRIHVEQIRLDISRVVTELGPERARLWTTAKSEIQGCRETLELAIRRLRRFQFDHGLSSRKAEYPESKWYHFSIIAAIAVFEWLALSAFYAEGSDFGLVGGVLFALAFSIINLGLAIGLGYGLRYLNHRSLSAKAICAVVGLFVATAFLAISLLAAHYRDVTEQLATERAAAMAAAANASTGDLAIPTTRDPLEASSIAVEHLKEDPWGLKHTWSWVLLTAALVFGVFAAYKGYKVDDAYPGYGAVDRDHRAADAAYAALKEKWRGQIDRFFKSQKAAVDTAYNGIVGDVRAYDRSIEQAHLLASDFEARSRQVAAQCQAVLQRYRQVNAQIRTDPPPAYFAGYSTLFSSESTKPIDAVASSESSSRERFAFALSQCRDEHESAGRKISEAHEKALIDFDQEVRTLEQWVAQQVASQNPALAAVA
jgi:hypothetical protein